MIHSNHSIKAHSRRACAQAFTRVDLIAVIVVVILFAGAGSFFFLGERGRTSRCAGNLHDLGKAIYRYSSDHREGIPTASVAIDKHQSTWDLQTFPFLKSGFASAGNEKLANSLPGYFSCPSDQLQRSGPPRSYAMGSNDMALPNWPPGENTATGVGLNWDRQSVLRLLDEEALKKPDALPELKLSVVPSPSDTVLLTELIAPNNVMGGVQAASVAGSAAQTFAITNGTPRFHKGRLNYLMVDGHVERLSGLQTGAIDGQAGIWTIKKGD